MNSPRQRKSRPFSQDDRCIGGMHMIQQQFQDMHRKIDHARKHVDNEPPMASMFKRPHFGSFGVDYRMRIREKKLPHVHSRVDTSEPASFDMIKNLYINRRVRSQYASPRRTTGKSVDELPFDPMKHSATPGRVTYATKSRPLSARVPDALPTAAGRDATSAVLTVAAVDSSIEAYAVSIAERLDDIAAHRQMLRRRRILRSGDDSHAADSGAAQTTATDQARGSLGDDVLKDAAQQALDDLWARSRPTAAHGAAPPPPLGTGAAIAAHGGGAAIAAHGGGAAYSHREYAAAPTQPYSAAAGVAGQQQQQQQQQHPQPLERQGSLPTVEDDVLPPPYAVEIGRGGIGGATPPGARAAAAMAARVVGGADVMTVHGDGTPPPAVPPGTAPHASSTPPRGDMPPPRPGSGAFKIPTPPPRTMQAIPVSQHLRRTPPATPPADALQPTASGSGGGAASAGVLRPATSRGRAVPAAAPGEEKDDDGTLPSKYGALRFPTSRGGSGDHAAAVTATAGHVGEPEEDAPNAAGVAVNDFVVPYDEHDDDAPM